jgi:hypothetical protein
LVHFSGNCDLDKLEYDFWPFLSSTADKIYISRTS